MNILQTSHCGEEIKKSGLERCMKRSIEDRYLVVQDRPVWRISVRLSDGSEATQHKINFVKKLPPVGFEPMTSWSPVSCSANWAREESVGDFWSELSFVSCTTSYVYFQNQ